jgi:PIN domain nuclease of toxin-antitoxin system
MSAHIHTLCSYTPPPSSLFLQVNSEAGKLALVDEQMQRRQALQDKIIDQDIQLQQVKAKHAEKLQETETEHADRCTVLLSERDEARETVVTRDATIRDLLFQLDLKGSALREERAKSDGLQVRY